jgi:hypothetical protein
MRETVDGASIAYQDFGELRSIVVIHGWITHLEVLWELPGCARFMRRLAERMRVPISTSGNRDVGPVHASARS